MGYIEQAQNAKFQMHKLWETQVAQAKENLCRAALNSINSDDVSRLCFVSNQWDLFLKETLTVDNVPYATIEYLLSDCSILITKL